MPAPREDTHDKDKEPDNPRHCSDYYTEREWRRRRDSVEVEVRLEDEASGGAENFCPAHRVIYLHQYLASTGMIRLVLHTSVFVRRTEPVAPVA